jgi:hypothetical protein
MSTYKTKKIIMIDFGPVDVFPFNRLHRGTSNVSVFETFLIVIPKYVLV